MYGYYSSMIYVIPAFLLAMWAQYKVKATYKKYSKVANRQGYTGAQIAQMILKRYGMSHVNVEPVAGTLSDHYDPRKKAVRLSQGVYNSRSLAAISIAAHECGHALQDEQEYLYLKLRHSIAPAVGFASKTAMPLAFIGLLLGAASSVGGIGSFVLQVAILMFTAVVVFHMVTLPVEFNASSRAMEILEAEGYLERDEIAPAKKVLDAAALTYVAAAAVALSNLIRFIVIARGRD